MKPAFALPLALVLAFLLAIPVAAAPPVIYEGTYDEDYTAPYFQTCPGIEVWDHEVLTWREWDYYDNKGNLTSVKLHFNGTDTFHNPANPGVELTGSFAGTTEVDLATGEFINSHGLPVKITIPGYGTAMVRAGLWSRYPYSHEAGKDSWEDPADLAAFCAALAGG